MVDPVDDEARESLRIFDLLVAQCRRETAEQIAQACEVQALATEEAMRLGHTVVVGPGIWHAAARLAREYGSRPVDSDSEPKVTITAADLVNPPDLRAEVHDALRRAYLGTPDPQPVDNEPGESDA